MRRVEVDDMRREAQQRAFDDDGDAWQEGACLLRIAIAIMISIMVRIMISTLGALLRARRAVRVMARLLLGEGVISSEILLAGPKVRAQHAAPMGAPIAEPLHELPIELDEFVHDALRRHGGRRAAVVGRQRPW